VAFCGGHTEIAVGIDRPMVIGTMLGEGEKNRLIHHSDDVSGLSGKGSRKDAPKDPSHQRTGRTVYLYSTRFNDGGLDRDLVREPVTFTHE